MKRLLLVFAFFLIFVFASCTTNEKNNQSAPIEVASSQQQKVLYRTQKTMLITSNDRNTIEYPQLVGYTEDYSTINSLILNNLVSWVDNISDADSTVSLNYSVTYKNNSYVCILFEGRVNSSIAAHPTNIVHSICISIIDKAIVNPLDLIGMDDEFIKQFKYQLSKTYDINHFSAKQWDVVVAYVNSFSNDEIVQAIKNGSNVFVDDGILICINVPHPIGDYIKVTVPLC